MTFFLTRVSVAEDAGKRDFPATLVVEEPQAETEVAPQIASSGNANNARQTDVGTELSVQLTDPFAVVLHPTFSFLHPGGNGFQNLETTLKYQFIAEPVQEVIFSAGLTNLWNSVGTQRVGADPFATVMPVVFFGKGAGDLPSSLDILRPLAMTTKLGFAIPTQSKSFYESANSSNAPSDLLQPNPYLINLEGSFQYSLVYASQNVTSLNIPQFVASLVPLVEYSFSIPVANNGAHAATTGTINPGFLWCHGDIQIGLEAIIPINHESGSHPGVRLQLAYAFKTPWIDAPAEPSDAKHDSKDRD